MSNHPNRSKKDLPRPALLLRRLSKRFPAAWKVYDQFRQDRGKAGLPDWPDWCYCPMAAAYAVVSGGGNLDNDYSSITDVQTIAALAAWRTTQGIYRFDTTISSAIKNTPIAALPVEILYRLPEWCVYIEESHEIGCGFFAHLEWDANTGRPELRFLFDIPDQTPQGMSLHLDQPTLDLAVRAMVEESRRQMVRIGKTHMAATVPPDIVDELAASIMPFLNLVLYLCTVNADFGGQRHPTRPQAKRTKNGWRLFPPDNPTVWEMGSRLGSALRASQESSQAASAINTESGDNGRARPRAHVRRAHWHTYLTGEGKTNPILKWLPPIPVNVADIDDLTATTHNVS